MSFFKERIQYLGHIVSWAGIETNPKKVEKVSKLAKTMNGDCTSGIPRMMQLLQELYQKF